MEAEIDDRIRQWLAVKADLRRIMASNRRLRELVKAILILGDNQFRQIGALKTTRRREAEIEVKLSKIKNRIIELDERVGALKNG